MPNSTLLEILQRLYAMDPIVHPWASVINAWSLSISRSQQANVACPCTGVHYNKAKIGEQVYLCPSAAPK